MLCGVASYALKWATLIELGAVRAVSARVMTFGRTRVVEDAGRVGGREPGPVGGLSRARILVDLV